MDARSTIKFYSLLPDSLVGCGSTANVDLASTAPTGEAGSNYLIYLARLIRRFWKKVDVRGDDDCWEWTASTKGNGIKHLYGQFYIKGYKMVRAHRVAWIIKNGKATENLLVLHKCNNPLCCNPAHLYLGTASDNSRDAVRAGTHTGFKMRGENRPHNKLTKYDVLEMRRLYETRKISYGLLAKIFRINYSQAWRIVNRKRWKHI